jgi:hypothetical protein
MAEEKKICDLRHSAVARKRKDGVLKQTEILLYRALSLIHEFPRLCAAIFAKD